MAGVQPHSADPAHSWRMQMIFDEGKEIHGKWQNRIWKLGRLAGTFYCQSCHYAWGDTAPEECANCHAGREFLRYHEVPLANVNLSLAGHADGLDGFDGPVIEIKSIGLGTLRYEAPNLIAEHTYKLNLNGKNRTFLDYDGLWDSIRRPFPSHVRQGDFYCFLGKYSEVIFLYECKWNQKVKEMIIRYQVDRIQDRLDLCSQITMALRGGRVPACPFDGCADCRRYEEKNANGGRVLIRRSPDSTQAPAQPPRDPAKNDQRQGRLQRFGSR